MRETLAIRAAAPLWAAIIGKLLQSDAPAEAMGQARSWSNNRLPRHRIASGAGKSRPSGGMVPGRDGAHGGCLRPFYEGPDGAGASHPAHGICAWCGSGQNTIEAVCPAAEKLAIIRPAPHAAFSVDPALPRSQQMLELACTGGLGRDVHWFVNDQEVAPRGNGRVYWPLTEGNWRISARAGGRRRKVSITVE